MAIFWHISQQSNVLPCQLGWTYGVAFTVQLQLGLYIVS